MKDEPGLGARLKWLYGLQANGIKLGLANITSLLKRMGNSQDAYPTIHVAGSDGKGSTCAIIASVLRAKGLRVGMYTSPHILDFKERISVDGMCITDAELSEIIGEFVDDMKESDMLCTFFEVTTAVAFRYFADKKVDVAVIEVGMGGRFDATNIITPLVSVVNNISLEHTQYLGDTIEKIAFEKAGIIKPAVPAVTINGDAAYNVLKEAADSRKASLKRVDPADIAVLENRVDGVKFSYKGVEHFVSVPGRNEAKNAVLALEALNSLGGRFGDLSEAVDRGFSSVRWPCRMELRDNGFIVDVTHTCAGAEGLARDIAEIYGKVVLVFGVLSDKNVEDICASLSKVATKVIVTAPKCERARPAEDTLSVMRRHVPDALYAPTVADAMDLALGRRQEREKVLVTGSFYMAEEALRWMGRTSL